MLIEHNYNCSFSVDLRFPLDGAVELHFSPTPEPRLPSPAPTPAVPTLDSSDDPVTRWDSYEHLAGGSDDDDEDAHSGECVSSLWAVSLVDTPSVSGSFPRTGYSQASLGPRPDMIDGQMKPRESRRERYATLMGGLPVAARPSPQLMLLLVSPSEAPSLLLWSCCVARI